VLLSDFTRKALKRVLATVDVLKETGLLRLDTFEAELLIVFAQLSITDSAEIQKSVFKLCAKALLLHSMNSLVVSDFQQAFAASPFSPGRVAEMPLRRVARGSNAANQFRVAGISRVVAGCARERPRDRARARPGRRAGALSASHSVPPRRESAAGRRAVAACGGGGA
jgi:hypothetical protein